MVRPSNPTLVLFLTALALLTAPVQGQSPSNPQTHLVLRGVNVLEGPRLEPRIAVSIVIEDGRIRRIGPVNTDAPDGATVLDFNGYWVVPGLVDAHSHLNTLDALGRALESGVTTVRTAGVGGYVDVAMRDATRDGLLSGPDIVATGVYVTPDIEDGALADPRLHVFLADSVDTEEELRLLVAVNAARGADWIKTRATERAGRPDTDPREQVYTEAELRAVVEEAALHGLSVAAHAHGDEGIQAAVQAGVKSVEHATYASDATLQLMKDHGTWLVPTLSSVLSFGQPGDYADPALFLRGQHLAPRRVDMVRRAHARGVPIVVGVDTDYGPGSTARVSRAVTFQVEELGFDPVYALQGAMSRAAELLGVADRTGHIAEGMEADLILIDSNPLERIRALQDPLAIISNGQIVTNRLPFGVKR